MLDIDCIDLFVVNLPKDVLKKTQLRTVPRLGLGEKDSSA